MKPLYTFVLLMLLPLQAHALTLTLKKCDMLSTSGGIVYVGMHCLEFECRFGKRFFFESWCPYQVDELGRE